MNLAAKVLIWVSVVLLSMFVGTYLPTLSNMYQTPPRNPTNYEGPVCPACKNSGVIGNTQVPCRCPIGNALFDYEANRELAEALKAEQEGL